MAIGLSLVGCAASTPASSSSNDPSGVESHERATLRVVLHFANDDDTDAVDAGRVGAWLAHAQSLLRPHGVDLELGDVQLLPPGSRADALVPRYRLLSQVDGDDAVHVMVVSELGGVRRDGTTTIRGLHFRAPLRGGQYIAIGPSATPSTMAHELGHAFGLEHVDDPDNVMCSCDRGSSPSFSAEQGRRIRAAISSR